MLSCRECSSLRAWTAGSSLKAWTASFCSTSGVFKSADALKSLYILGRRRFSITAEHSSSCCPCSKWDEALEMASTSWNAKCPLWASVHIWPWWELMSEAARGGLSTDTPHALSSESLAGLLWPPARALHCPHTSCGSFSIYQPPKLHAQKWHFLGIKAFLSLEECSMWWVADLLGSWAIGVSLTVCRCCLVPWTMINDAHRSLISEKVSLGLVNCTISLV